MANLLRQFAGDEHRGRTSEETLRAPMHTDPPSSADDGTRTARFVFALNPTAGIWGGLVVIAAGFAVIFMAWGKVAGLTSVAGQMPYVLSGGLTGLGLIIVGAVAVDVAARRQDSQERHRQLVETAFVLRELRQLFETKAGNKGPSRG